MNNIDYVMDLDPLALTPEDIDNIIAYHRRSRANFESGVKPKKEEGPKLTLADLGIAPQKPKLTLRRM